MRGFIAVIAGAAVLWAAAGSASAAPVKWQHKCFPHYHFCANFPSNSSGGVKYTVYKLPLGSSADGKEPAFSSTVGRYCMVAKGSKCQRYEGDQGYEVSVFRSKFADPWTAITAINGGVRNPIRTTVQGNLAAIIPKGIYGGKELVIYHRGLVYYAASTTFGLVGSKPQFTQRFLDSIKLT